MGNGNRAMALIDYNIYLGAMGEKFVCEGTIELPEVKYLTTEISPSGVAGKLNVPLLGQTEAMEVTIEVPTIDGNAIQAAALAGDLITARMAMQQKDMLRGGQSVLAETVVMRAQTSSFKPGTIEKGATKKASFTFQVDYIKITSDGKTLFEHDKLNNILIVNGQDTLSDVREAI